MSIKDKLSSLGDFSLRNAIEITSSGLKSAVRLGFKSALIAEHTVVTATKGIYHEVKKEMAEAKEETEPKDDESKGNES